MGILSPGRSLGKVLVDRRGCAVVLCSGQATQGEIVAGRLSDNDFRFFVVRVLFANL